MFLAEGIGMAKLQVLLQEDRDNRSDQDSNPFPFDSFRLKKEHIQKTTEHSNNSASGPGGIPFLVWRTAGSLAAGVLRGAFQDAIVENGPERFAEKHPDFNASLLLVIRKKASGTIFCDTNVVRPLNVMSADNRLLANFFKEKV